MHPGPVHIYIRCIKAYYIRCNKLITFLRDPCNKLNTVEYNRYQET